MLEQLKKSDFECHLSESFKIQLSNSDTLEAELIEVSAMGGNRADENELASRAPFSIVFRASKNVTLEQNTYRIEHPSLNTMDIFLVPIGPDEQGMCYEAVFN